MSIRREGIIHHVCDFAAPRGHQRRKTLPHVSIASFARVFVLAILQSIVFVSTANALAAPPAPSDLTIADRPNDAGNALEVSWTPPQDLAEITKYELRVSSEPEADGTQDEALLFEAASDAKEFVVENLEPNHPYRISIVTIDDAGERSEVVAARSVGVPSRNFFNLRRTWLAILLAIVCGVVLAYILAARRGMTLWVRPIAGLEAVGDAVGRAVEMGKSILFVPGIQDINDIQTVAGITILSRVARTVAEYDAEIKVPTARSLVMATARETVEASYLFAGRPDSYNADDIYYLTNEQFGYVAGVTGHMVRDKPAACFYMGAFFAESLILAETGNAIGSIQVAGTAMPSQLPFFIAACDYTLIGEEFFAASAYLSGEPQQLGSLKGQDFGKLLCAALMLIGCVIAPFAIQTESDVTTRERRGAMHVFDYLHDNILGEDGLFPEAGE